MTRPSSPGKNPHKFEVCRGGAARFIAQKDGSVTLLNLALVSATLVTMGLALDVMRTEYERTKIQATCDAAVLAAADIDQPWDATRVVESYFAAAGREGALDAVTRPAAEAANSRTVSAVASSIVPTSFLRMARVDAFSADADCTANQTVPDVEISLVLDVSSSMGSHNRMENMQAAAREFVCMAIPGTPAEVAAAAAAGETGACAGNEIEGSASDAPEVTLSLVPYSMAVNVPAKLWQHLGVDEFHDRSRCLMFDDDDFESAAFDPTHAFSQYPNFFHGNWRSKAEFKDDGVDRLDFTTCPRVDEHKPGEVEKSPLVPMAADRTTLLDAIDGLQMHGPTGIDNGMRWGIGLLDPGMQGVISQMVADGDLPAIAAGRPSHYVDDTTTKIAIMMTDGDPDGQRNLHSAFLGKPGTPEAMSNVWYDAATDDYSVLVRGGYLRDFPYTADAADRFEAYEDHPVVGDLIDDDLPSSSTDYDSRHSSGCGNYWTNASVKGGESSVGTFEAEGLITRDGVQRIATPRSDVADWCHPVWLHEDNGEFRGYPDTAHNGDSSKRNDWDLHDAEGSLQRLTWVEVFDRFATGKDRNSNEFRNDLWLKPKQQNWLSNAEWNILREARRDDTDRAEHTARLKVLCDAAKRQGIQVFTVAFEMDLIGNATRREDARELMRACASGDTFHFDVESAGITEAFRAIAGQINHLRLTQ